ncbi:MAG TPA: hypothetical protein VER32_16510, partial [Pyrinomonadaceae bacterium]|nr:hypothetical protein [Pyrinomonadaceae bacterium]
MTPEISRRCRACGASVRAGGRFCQQCGEKFEATPGGEAADANTDPNENVNANAAAPEAPKPAAPEEYAGAFRRPASGAPPPAHAPEVREVKPARDENNGAAASSPNAGASGLREGA